MANLKFCIKKIPLFLFNFINILLLFIMCLGYILEIYEPSLSWGTEGCGWYWENPLNFTCYCLIWIIFLAGTLYGSFKLRHRHLFFATIMSFFSIIIFIIDYIYRMYLLTGEIFPFVYVF